MQTYTLYSTKQIKDNKYGEKTIPLFCLSCDSIHLNLVIVILFPNMSILFCGPYTVISLFSRNLLRVILSLHPFMSGTMASLFYHIVFWSSSPSQTLVHILFKHYVPSAPHPLPLRMTPFGLPRREHFNSALLSLFLYRILSLQATTSSNLNQLSSICFIFYILVSHIINIMFQYIVYSYSFWNLMKYNDFTM